jgi:DNA-binding CsgD family transcriptional regulator
MATQVEIAEALGISERWLRQKITDGVIKPAARGQFDLATVARQYIASQGDDIARLKAENASKQAELDRMTSTPSGIDKADADARRAVAMAERAEMETALMRGDLIPSEQIADALNAAVQTMKSRVRGVPAKVAAQLGARDAAHAERVIRGAIDQALDELARVNVKGDVAA